MNWALAVLWGAVIGAFAMLIRLHPYIDYDAIRAARQRRKGRQP